jgi:hypothetical protein
MEGDTERADFCWKTIAKKTSDGQYAEAFANFKSFSFVGQQSPALFISNVSADNPVGSLISMTTVGGNGNPLKEFNFLFYLQGQLFIFK